MDPAQIESLALQKDRASAIDALLQLKAESPLDFYNLGTAFLQLGASGTARAYLRSAHLRDVSGALPPSVLNTNLEMAERSLRRERGERPFAEVSSPLETAAEALPLPVAMALVFALVVGGAISLGRGRRKLASALSLIAIAAWSLLQLGVASTSSFVRQEVPVFSGPGTTYLELTRLPAGCQLRHWNDERKDSHGVAWRKVRYARDREGWIQSDAIL